MSIVKRQHYVWRNYLRAWSKNDKIWTFMKESNKLFLSDLMGVAQERYFYKLIDLTDTEEAFLKTFIDRNSGHLVKDLNLDYLVLFTSTSKLKKNLDQIINPDIEKEKYAEEIRKLEINLMEISHGKMENLGFNLLKYRNLDQLKIIEKDDYFFDAIMFMCFQYFRTKSTRESVMNSFLNGPHEQLASKTWNILSYVLATNLAQKISLDSRLRFQFIENNTGVPFITSDQPIFNIVSDKVNDDGEVVELEFYYPIAPICALAIHFRNDQIEKFNGVSADDSMVMFYNKKVFENADSFVFADSREPLQDFIE